MDLAIKHGENRYLSQFHSYHHVDLPLVYCTQVGFTTMIPGGFMAGVMGCGFQRNLKHVLTVMKSQILKENKFLFLDEDLVSLSHPFLINTRISYVYL
jgi:hypothetical protein